MKIIKRTVLCVFATVLSCLPMQAMKEQPQKIEGVEGLQKAMRSLVRENFDKGNLSLFDGADGVNQCHLNALMVRECAREGKFDALKPDQQLFLVNNLLRSEPLHLNSNSGPRILERLLSSTLPSSMKSSLKSGKSALVKEMITQLIKPKKEFFDEHLGPLIGLQWKDVALDEGDGGAILPKFVGIKSLLEHLKRCKDLWMVLKCKTTCAQGAERMQTFLIHPDQQKFLIPGSEDTPDSHCSMPVLVVEGKAKIPSPKFDEHSKRLQKLNPEQVQLAVAAAWMKVCQGDACPKLPDNLRREFEVCVQFAHEHGLSHNNPETFFIQHMFPDMLKNALERNRLLSDDMSPDSVFKEAGLEGVKQ